MKPFLIVLIVLACLYLLICIGIYSLQEKMLFPGPALSEEYKFYFPPQLNVEEVEIPASEGKLHGIYVRAKNPSGCVLYFHGNGGSVQDWVTVASRFVDRGLNVLIMDYRGYGKSRGKRTQDLLLADADLAYRFVREHWSNEQILVYGRSLGSGFASYIASKESVACLMLETPYLSIRKVSQERFSWLPVGALLRFPMLSNQYITQVNCPVFVIHGTADQVIPVHHGRELSKIPSIPYVVYEEVQGGTHNDLENFPQYKSWLEEGLAVLPSAPTSVE